MLLQDLHLQTFKPIMTPVSNWLMMEDMMYLKLKQVMKSILVFLGPNESESVTLTFLAPEPGKKMIFASVSGDNVDSSEEASDAYTNTTITVVADETADNSHAKHYSSSKMLATGNPLALLALALLVLVPYCRRR